METHKRITELKDVLSHGINLLYNGEKQLKLALADCIELPASAKLKDLLVHYLQQIDDKLLKLQRVFNYLMEEPSTRPNKVMDKMIAETHQMLDVSSPAVKDAVLVSCIRSVVSYKIAGYKIARTFAMELEMGVVTELMDEILTWEKEAERELEKIAVLEVNVRA